jgi:hypothetical protein
MVFKPKTKRVGTVREFLRGEDAIKREVKKLDRKLIEHGLTTALTTVGGSLVLTVRAGATSPTEYIKETAKQKIVDAFKPLIEMVQALSYPIALIMLTGGALCFMIGQKDRGISLIQNAAIGYILVHIMPLLMEILVGIGNSVGVVAPLLFFV